MTLLVSLVLVGALVVGVAIIFYGTRSKSRQPDVICPGCKQANPGQAHFCSQCGQQLPR